MTFTRSAGASAAVVFFLTLAVGVVVAYTIGSAISFDGGQIAVMTAQPLDGATKTFNWLIFAGFTAAGIVAGAIVWAAVLVNNAIIESTVETIQHRTPSANGFDPPQP